MKLKKLAAITALALVATITLASSARAQVTYDSANGDFLIGFRQQGNTNSILADIGPILDFSVTQTFSLGNIGTLLSSTFGSNWANDPTVFMSIASTQSPALGRTNYVTFSDQVRTTPWNRLTNTNSGTLQNKIVAMGNQYNTFAGQQTPGNPAVIEAQAQAPDGYREYMPGGTNDAGHATGNIGFGFFNPTTEANFGGGIAGIGLHLEMLAPGSGAGTVLGDFSLSQDASLLTFSPVPEPSSFALLTLAIVTTGVVVCRRSFYSKTTQS
jgi:hypothetical protein